VKRCRCQGSNQKGFGSSFEVLCFSCAFISFGGKEL